MANPWENDKGFQEWLNKRKAPTVTPTNPVKEDPNAKRIYTYSKSKLESSWRGNHLKGLSTKAYGRSYDDKLSNWVKAKGGSDADAEGFRYWMNKRAAGMKQAEAEREKTELHNYKAQQYMNDPVAVKNTRKLNEESIKKQVAARKVDKPWTEDVKSGLSKALKGIETAGEIIDRPGDAVRSVISNLLKGESFTKGLKEGFTGKQNTSGVQLNNQIANKLGLNTKKSKVDDVAFNLLSRQTLNVVPGGNVLATALGKKNAKVGEELLGMGTETSLDPTNLIGIGGTLKVIKALDKGKVGLNALEKVDDAADVAKTGSKEILGLPEPKLQLPGPSKPKTSLETFQNTFKPINGLDNPIPEMPKPMSQKLNQLNLEKQGVNFGYNTKIEPKARINRTPIETPMDPLNRPQSYWQGRYEEFSKHVNQNYDMNKMTPEALDDLWSQFAKYDEPIKLEQAVELAYPKGFEAPPVQKPVVEPPLKQALKQDDKINELIKGLYPPKAPETKISRPATFDEMVERLQSLAPPKKSEPAAEPLQFRRLAGGMETRAIQPTAVDRKVTSFKEEFDQVVKSEAAKLKKANVGATDEELMTTAASQLKGWKPKALTQIEKQIARLNKTLTKSPEKSNAIKPTLKILEKEKKEMEDALLKLDLQMFGGKQKKPSLDRLKHGTPKTKEVLSNSESLNTKELQEIKDIAQPQVGTQDLYRLADRLPEKQKTAIQSSLDNAKRSYVKQLEELTNDVYEKVVKGLNIKKGSKDSALVQDFGEKTLVKKYLRKRGIDPKKLSNEEIEKINLQQLKKVHPDKWQRIVEADKYFRETYNRLIDEVNAVRTQIYPNNPEKIVPKRNDYYHHFNELTGLEGVKNLFDTPSNIDPALEGISPFTKPKAKFQGFMQKRGNGRYTSDAVGGFLKYLRAASHSINVDPVIPVLRNVKKEIITATSETRNANKIIESLEDHANDIAGKTNPIDRFVMKGIGRKGMRVLEWANSRVKANMILGNLGSTLGQLGNIPLGIGKAKQYTLPGLKDTVSQTVKEILRADKTAPIYQSTFLKERFADSLFRRFDQKLIEQPRKLAAWMLETGDKAGTRFIWNSMYNKGLKEGVEDAIKYADYETRKIIAGRGVGEVPLFQKSKTFQVLTPFTLEVGNQWRVLKDMVGEKDAAGIITFLIASYGLNKAVEQVRGSGVSFDPIDALIDGYNQKDGDTKDKSLNALASLTGEVVGNIPGGNLLTQFADTEKKIPLTDMRYKELFGERNPNRFGTGLTLGKALEDPLYLLAPFGASQFRKTVSGIDALRSEGVYKNDKQFVPFTGPKSELMYPIEKGKLENLKLPLFGPSSSSEAREYYTNKRRPLSEKQTAEYESNKESGNGTDYYESLMFERRKKTIERKIKEVEKDSALSEAKKTKEILRLRAELNKLNNQ